MTKYAYRRQISRKEILNRPGAEELAHFVDGERHRIKRKLADRLADKLANELPIGQPLAVKFELNEVYSARDMTHDIVGELEIHAMQTREAIHVRQLPIDVTPYVPPRPPLAQRLKRWWQNEMREIRKLAPAVRQEP